jgi:hypothetical protein
VPAAQPGKRAGVEARLTEGCDATGPFVFVAARARAPAPVPGSLTLSDSALQRLLPSLFPSQARHVPARLQVRDIKPAPPFNPLPNPLNSL